MITRDRAIEYLDRHIGLGVRPGLERMEAILDLMGRPEHGYPILHVAGTNGKTSTARIATSLLAAHGLAVGTFTSPHLERIEERFAYGGEPVSAEDFAQAIEDVMPFVDIHVRAGGEPPTYFELTALAAFALFANLAVDVAVIEVGLGGRLDATNAADATVAVVTTIDVEHVEYLGHDLAGIAREKVAIAKPGCTLVGGELPPDAAAEVQARVDRLGLPFVRVGVDVVLDEARMAVGGWLCRIHGLYDVYDEVFLPLHGRHQTQNLALAVAAVEALLGRALSIEALREGAAATTSPGRLEVVGHHPLIVLDGAHNPHGVRALVDALEEEFPDISWTLVFGAMGDKDVAAMAGRLLDIVSAVIVTSPRSERSVPAGELADAVAELNPSLDISEEPDVAAAVRRAVDRVGDDGAVLVAGSLYLVGEARTALALRPPEEATA